MTNDRARAALLAAVAVVFVWSGWLPKDRMTWVLEVFPVMVAVPVLLVGDSVAMVVQGRQTTVSVTMEQMLYHCSIVTRGVERALVVGDMPFMSYQVNSDDALRNAPSQANGLFVVPKIVE